MHLLRRLEMPLGGGEAAEAKLLDRAGEADGGDHVLQRPPVGDVIVHVVGGDQAHLHLGGKIVEVGQPPRIVAAEQHVAREIAAVAEQACEPAQALMEGGIVDLARRQDDGNQALGELREIIEGEIALALGGAAIARRQQARQPLVAVEVHRIGDQRIAVASLEPCTDQKLDPAFLGDRGVLVEFLDRRIGAHDARQRVAVGDADGVVAKLDRAPDELARMRAAAQEAVVGRDLEFGVVHAQLPKVTLKITEK